MKKSIVLGFLLFCSATVYANDSTWVVDGYGSKVSFTYPAIDFDYLGVETLNSLNQPGLNKLIFSPVWSPDGKTIAFTDCQYIYQVPAGGGEAEIKHAAVYLCPYKDSNYILYETINKIVGYSPDGSTLYFLHTPFDEESGVSITITDTENGGCSVSINNVNEMALASLDLVTGEVTNLARHVGNAELSCGGKYLLYADDKLTTVNGEDLTTGETWAFATPTGFIAMFTSSADGKYFIYSGSAEDGSGQLFRMPIKGGASEQLSTYPGGDTGYNRYNPFCTADGEWILYDDYGTVKYSNEITSSEGSISYDKFIIKMCAFNVNTKETIDLFPASTVIDTEHGRLSPDGKRICYSCQNIESISERNSIYIKDISSLPASEPDQQTAVAEAVPKGFALSGNYPNPFNPSTHIAFTLPSAGSAQLSVYDITGRKVRDLLTSTMTAGTHEMVWDGRDESGAAVSSGTYIARLKMGNVTASHRMTLMK